VASPPDAAVPGSGFETADRLEAIRPFAPAELVADVDAGIAFYDGADRAAGTDPATILQLTRAWGTASARILDHCGITG
jgi:hypothetical protein